MRAVLKASGLRLLVAWMLTPDDGRNDGNFTSYLGDANRWSHHDPLLFHGMESHLTTNSRREVALIEGTDLLAKTKYFSAHVPDTASGRTAWFEAVLQQAHECDLVFLDPDNGLDIKSKPYGSRNSSKYLFRHEVEALWQSKKSLLMYQHFIREERTAFIQRMLEDLGRRTPGSVVEAFATPNVVFLMALQPDHHVFHDAILRTVQQTWEGQIRHWEPPDPERRPSTEGLPDKVVTESTTAPDSLGLLADEFNARAIHAYGERTMHLRQIKPTTISLLLAALVMVVVGTYTDNGGFQFAGVILLVVVLITAFNQARDRGKL